MREKDFPSRRDREELFRRAEQLAEDCRAERRHARRVAELALRLFDDLAPLHRLPAEAKLLLELAALLHDIGWVQGRAGHHKASCQLILADDRLPLGNRERMIVAGTARYHRKALPRPEHEPYASLSPDDRKTVCLLAGILRLADGLDCSHSDAVREARGEIEGQDIVIRVWADGPAKDELAEAAEKSDLLQQAFRRNVRIDYCAAARGRNHHGGTE